MGLVIGLLGRSDELQLGTNWKGPKSLSRISKLASIDGSSLLVWWREKLSFYSLASHARSAVVRGRLSINTYTTSAHHCEYALCTRPLNISFHALRRKEGNRRRERRPRSTKYERNPGTAKKASSSIRKLSGAGEESKFLAHLFHWLASERASALVFRRPYTSWASRSGHNCRPACISWETSMSGGSRLVGSMASLATAKVAEERSWLDTEIDRARSPPLRQPYIVPTPIILGLQCRILHSVLHDQILQTKAY